MGASGDAKKTTRAASCSAAVTNPNAGSGAAVVVRAPATVCRPDSSDPDGIRLGWGETVITRTPRVANSYETWRVNKVELAILAELLPILRANVFLDDAADLGAPHDNPVREKCCGREGVWCCDSAEFQDCRVVT